MDSGWLIVSALGVTVAGTRWVVALWGMCFRGGRVLYTLERTPQKLALRFQGDDRIE